MGKKKRKKIQINIPHNSAKVISYALFGGFVFVFLLCAYVCYDIPSLSLLNVSTRKSSIIFEDCNGNIIASYGDLFGKVVMTEELPKHVYQAVLAIEDRRFYKHFGVDLIGVFRAIHSNIMKNKIQGASTITQQLAKNLFLTPDRSIKRKLQELILSFMIESKFTKNQILTIYLNRVYFGGGAYGIDAAAHRFFGKNAKDLDLLESAKLAACLKSPTAYSPISNQDASDTRAAIVLSAMLECGFVKKIEVDECIENCDKNYKITETMSDNRYFTDWVMEIIPNLCSSDEDLIVRTTLDRRMQKNAVAIIRKYLLDDGFKLNINQMALVCMDSTGAVKSMVGGHTYSQSQFNRCFAARSAGSSFKFFVYLNALENGLDPLDHVSDNSIKIGNWSPKNYHWQSRGQLTLCDAFAYSVNTCAVRLAKKFGVRSVKNTARKLGFSCDIPNDLTMALGSGAANIFELTACYGAVLNSGYKIDPYGIISIRTKSGKLLYRKRIEQKRVLSYGVCEKMKKLLKSVVDYGTGKKAKLPIQAYGKSGTSNNSMDACFAGFAKNLATSVWVGNDVMSPMAKSVTGGTIPARVWHDYMYSVLYNEDLSYDIPEIKIDMSKLADQKRRRKKISNFIKHLEH